MKSKTTGLALLVGLGALLSACSGSASFSINGKPLEEAAEALIAGDIADELDLGVLDPKCGEVDKPQVGSVFACTATTDDGQVIEFSGVVDSEDHIKVEAVNVMSGPSIAADLFEALKQDEAADGIQLDEIDCGDVNIVVSGHEVICDITPPSGEPRSATLTMSDVKVGGFQYELTPPTPDQAADATPDDIATDDPLLAMADAALIQASHLAGGWEETPQTDDGLKTDGLEGCDFFDSLLDADGHLVESMSSEFALEDIVIAQTVRVYEDTETAISIVTQWANQETINCYIGAGQIQFQEMLDTGELDPFDTAELSTQAYQDHTGEPRFTNLEMSVALSSPGQQLTILDDRYFIQVDQMVSMVSVSTVGTLWDETLDVVDLIADLMDDAAQQY